MNKQAIITLTLIVFASAFGMGCYLYKNNPANRVVEEIKPVLAEKSEAKEDNKLIREHSPIIGNVNAPVTIVEFIDPACEACRAFFPYVEDVRKQYPNDVRVVYRFAPFHPASLEAVKILLAANKQGLFHPVMEELFATQPEWSPHREPPNIDIAWNMAASKGVDVEKAKKDVQEADIQEMIVQEKDDLRFFMIRQTPTFFINGKQIRLSSPMELNSVVVEAIQKVQIKE